MAASEPGPSSSNPPYDCTARILRRFTSYIQHIYHKRANHQCFQLAVLTALYPEVAQLSKTSILENVDTMLTNYAAHYIWPASKSPTLEEIAYFERVNNIGITIYQYETDALTSPIRPLYLNPKKYGREVLLVFHLKHFYLVRDLRRLVKINKNCQHRFGLRAFVVKE